MYIHWKRNKNVFHGAWHILNIQCNRMEWVLQVNAFKMRRSQYISDMVFQPGLLFYSLVNSQCRNCGPVMQKFENPARSTAQLSHFA